MKKYIFIALLIFITTHVFAAPSVTTVSIGSITSTTAIPVGTTNGIAAWVTGTAGFNLYTAGGVFISSVSVTVTTGYYAGSPSNFSASSNLSATASPATALTFTGLAAGTSYQYQAYFINGGITYSGAILSFTTSAPTLSTTAITGLTSTNASSGGNTMSGFTLVSSEGVCWAVFPTTPTTANPKTSDGTNTASFSSSITGLTVGTTYIVRAYAIQGGTTYYGNSVTFTAPTPAVTTTTAASIGANGASSGGTPSNSTTISAEGVVWATTANPTTANSLTSDGTSTSAYTSSITGLNPSTTYHYRAYIIVGGITYYDTDHTFTTAIPAVTTTTATSVTANGATSGGTANVTTTTASGVVWATTANPTTANSLTNNGTSGTYTSAITGLNPSTTYHYRAYIIYAGTTYYDTDHTFTTGVPSVTTTTATSVSSVTATSGGTPSNISSATAEGVVWATTANPTIANSLTSDGTSASAYASSITGLTPATLYHYRAYITIAGTTYYGTDLQFTTTTVSLTTSGGSSITSTTATSGGTSITNGTGLTQKGVVWSTSANPTMPSGLSTNDGTGTADYTSSLTGLLPGGLYFVRSYVVLGGVYYYGTQQTITTTFPAGTTYPVSIASRWRFANNAGLDFSGGIATPTPAAQNQIPAGSVEASTTIVDTANNIMLHTDTRNIFNTGLVGDGELRYIESLDAMAAGSATQGAIGIPDPNNPYGSYYLFLANDISGGSQQFKGINYYKFTRSGGVTSYASGPINLIGNIVDESIMAVPDGNGNYWLLSHHQTNNDFYVWKVTASGISGPTTYTATGLSNPAGVQSSIRVNSCVNKVAWATATVIRVHSFNQATGAIGLNPIYIGSGAITKAYQVEFSPDGTKLYASGMNYSQLYQIDLNTGTGTMLASGAANSGVNEFWGLQLGPNGNLYASGLAGASGSNQYWEITNPNTTSPTITLKSLAAGTSVYRGISNQPLIGSGNGVNAGGRLKRSPTSCKDFMFGFKYYDYNNKPIPVTSATWTFTDNTTSLVTTVNAPVPYTDSINYILPTSNSFTVTLTITTAYCNPMPLTKTFTVTPNCALPIEFLSIGATSQPGVTKVIWSTAMERNSSTFNVQRSTDGKNFQTIGTVDAAGNSRSIKNYTYLDKEPSDGTIYYRVVENDEDGQKLYSTIVSTASQPDGKIYTISNNPFKNEFSLNLIGEKDIRIDIFEASGKLVYSNRIEDASGSIGLGSDLNSGAYILEVIDNITGKAYRDKLLKY